MLLLTASMGAHASLFVMTNADGGTITVLKHDHSCQTDVGFAAVGTSNHNERHGCLVDTQGEGETMALHMVWDDGDVETYFIEQFTSVK